MPTLNPYQKEITKVETQFCGRTLSLEVNRLATKKDFMQPAEYLVPDL